MNVSESELYRKLQKRFFLDKKVQNNDFVSKLYFKNEKMLTETNHRYMHFKKSFRWEHVGNYNTVSDLPTFTIPYFILKYLMPSGYGCFVKLLWREVQRRAQYNLHDLLLLNIAGSGRHKTGCGGHHKDGAEAGGNQGSSRPSVNIQEY
jgi:hypothetical protein